MAERYSRLFTAKTDLYIVGSPVILSAGALLKDNQTDKVLAQLKIKNISNKHIKAAKVSIASFNTIGEPLGEETDYEYLDLNVARDEEFGQKKLISLPNASTRAFSVTVSEIAFEDNSVWNNSLAAVEPLSPSTALIEKLNDAELVKQYGLRYGQTAVWPEKTLDLWYCACGAINNEEEKSCHICGGQIESLLACNLDSLKADCSKRLAEETAEREAKEAAARAAKEAAARKTKKALSIVLPVAVACIALILLLTKVVIPSSNYNKALKYLESERFDEATVLFEKLGDYKDSSVQLDFAKHGKEYAEAYAKAEVFLATGDKAHAAMSFGKAWNYKDASERSKKLWAELLQTRSYISTVASGGGHTAAVLADGTAVAVGSREERYDKGQFDVDTWTELQAITACGGYTLGLKRDGSVVATGQNNDNQCDVQDWKDIVYLETGEYYNSETHSSIYLTVGLRSDGTVVATGNNDYGQCNLEDWSNIVAVSNGGAFTVGLKADGTVVAVGKNDFGQCKVNKWSDIVFVTTGLRDTVVGLKADGTVVAAGDNSNGQCDVSMWRNITAVSAGAWHTVGLRADGTVLSIGLGTKDKVYDTDSWSNIIAVSAGAINTVGLKADGTVVATGDNRNNQCDVSDWKDVLAVQSYEAHTVGLKADGTAYATGYNGGGQCDVDDWNNILIPEHLK